MTLQERLMLAHTRSTALYLERQAVQLAQQQATVRAQQIDLALVELDGEIRTLEALIAETA